MRKDVQKKQQGNNPNRPLRTPQEQQQHRRNKQHRDSPKELRAAVAPYRRVKGAKEKMEHALEIFSAPNLRLAHHPNAARDLLLPQIGAGTDANFAPDRERRLHHDVHVAHVERSAGVAFEKVVSHIEPPII